jgi:glycosyltransferase involved in cell wall biosynthesis
MENHKSVIFAISSLSGGGAERVVVTLINSWKNNRFRPVLLVAKKAGPYLSDILPGIDIVSVDIDLYASKTLEVVKRLRCIFRELQPAVVFSHLSGMNRMIMRAKKLKAFDAPVVVVEHNNFYKTVNGRGRSSFMQMLLKKEMSWLYRSADAIVGVSSGVSESVQQSLMLPSTTNITTVYNPINRNLIQGKIQQQPAIPFAKEFLDLPKPIIISIGRLVKQKGFDDLISAFAALPDYQRGSLVILGEGILEEELKSLAIKLNIGSNCHLPGFVSNPWWFMARSDLFVSSSYWEGFPMSVLEAIACQIPIVSTDCPYGVNEIIEDGHNGRLVAVGNISQLSLAIQEALSNKTVSQLWAKRGISALDKFQPEFINDCYLKLVNL